MFVCRPTAHQLPQPFYLRRARWRRRAAVAAVPSPVALDGLPVCPALTMTRPVPFLLAVMVGPLLRSHLEQRRPAAETVEPRLSASPARHPSLELGAGKARSLLFPSPVLVPHATGVPLSLLGTGAGALQRPRRVLGNHSPPPPAYLRWSCRAVSRRDRPIRGDSTGRWSLAESCRIPGHPLMLLHAPSRPA